MAHRRMFSIDIVETDNFIELPHSAQCLYFHLVMTADDDGFTATANRTVRYINASQDDLQLLIEKGYLIPFPDVNVFAITDFLQQNQIRADRYHKTIYMDQKSQLRITENKKYVKIEDNQKHSTRSQSKNTKNNTSPQTNNQVTSNRLPVDNQMETGWQPDASSDQSSPVECSSDDDDFSVDDAGIIDTFEQEIGRKPLPGELSTISGMARLMEFDPGVAEFAIELAARNGAKSVTAYVRKVLDTWEQHGLKSLEDVHTAYSDGELRPRKAEKNYYLPE